MMLNRLSHFKESLVCFDKAIELDPETASIWFTKGMTHAFLGQNDDAEKCIERAAHLDPEGSDQLKGKVNEIFNKIRLSRE